MMLLMKTSCRSVNNRPVSFMSTSTESSNSTDDDSCYPASSSDDHDFFSRQARLQAEAKLALAQV